MYILSPVSGDSSYAYAVSKFKEMYSAVCGREIDILTTPSQTEDMIIIGSEAVQPFVYGKIPGGLPIKAGSDDYCLKSVEENGRNLLFLAGGRGRSTIYAVYDFFERRCGCHYFWDGDIIPSCETVDITGLDITESPRFIYRAIRYFAHRGLERFQAEHWDLAEWKKEIDWLLKSRLNVFMLRIGIDDLFQKAFPDFVSYPSNEERLPEATESYNDRTTFWPLAYRGELRKKVLDYAFSLDLIHPEDCGTMTHWYSRTPLDFLNHEKPTFLNQTNKSQSEQTGLVWDIFDEKNIQNYRHLTDTHIKEYGKPELFHTIGLAERTYNTDRRVNTDLKKYAYRRIIDYVSSNYPNAPLMIAAWDFYFTLQDDEVREIVRMFDPEKTVILDYTVDLKRENNNFEKWDIIGNIPWIFGIFHAYEPQNHIHGDYEYITEKLKTADRDPFCKGMAFWPEVSHSDTLMLEYFRENAWRPSGRTVEEIAFEMCDKRYASAAQTMKEIWKAFLPVLKLPSKCYTPVFFDILNPNETFLSVINIENASHSQACGNWNGFEDYGGTFDSSIKKLFELVHDLPESLWNNAFIKRDAVDMMKSALLKKLQYKYIKLAYSVKRMLEGSGNPESIRILSLYTKKMLGLFGELLGLHDDYSMYVSLRKLEKNRPINPHFENALKENTVNWYCRSSIYELVEGIYKKEADVFYEWLGKTAENGYTGNITSDIAGFAEKKAAIFREFKETPLEVYSVKNNRSYKAVTCDLIKMMEMG